MELNCFSNIGLEHNIGNEFWAEIIAYDDFDVLQSKSISKEIKKIRGYEYNTLSTQDPNDYGWNALSGAIGTAGTAGVTYGLSKFNISLSLKRILLPVGSTYAGESFGDVDNLKNNINILRMNMLSKLRENIIASNLVMLISLYLICIFKDILFMFYVMFQWGEFYFNYDSLREAIRPALSMYIPFTILDIFLRVGKKSKK